MPRDDDVLVELDELEATLRHHEGPPGPLTRTLSAAQPPRRARARRLLWTGGIAVAALLVGSGLGFGLGSSVTPSGTAGTTFAGTGFVPSRGWSVVQSGTVRLAETGWAIAANVPVRAETDPSEIPTATLASLPPRGVLVHAIFTARGDPGEDVKFPEHELPLLLASARPAASFLGAFSEQRLHAGVGGHNVEVRVFYGRTPPTQGMIGAAQDQLNRLVVGSARVTLSARPTRLGALQNALLFGAVDNGRRGEQVELRVKDCGQPSVRSLGLVTTEDGGTWTQQFSPGVNTTVHAVWKDAVSAPVLIQQAPRMLLQRRPGRLEIGVGSKGKMWRKKVTIQRRQGSRWVPIRQVLLTDQVAPGRSDSTWTEAEFRVSVPRGSVLRAVLPASQSRPCYLPGVSNTVRT